MANNNTSLNGVTNSRLLTSTTNFREKLLTRNLYTPTDEYEIDNNSTVETVSKLIGFVTPFRSFNLENTVIGRMINNPSPLSSMSLVFLGKQFAYNMTSNLQQQLPSINVANLFDNNKSTKLFTPFVDYRITRKEDTTTFENFINQIVYTTTKKDYPFNKKSTNFDFIKNTGKAQLNLLSSNLNNNIYVSDVNESLYEFGGKNNEISRINIDFKDKKYYNFDNNKFYPYSYYSIIKGSHDYIEDANNSMRIAYSQYYYGEGENDYLKTSIQEYAPNKDYINNNFGKTYKNVHVPENISDWTNQTDNEEFKTDGIENKLIWGRDGLNSYVRDNLDELRGLSEREAENAKFTQDVTSFKIRNGLLEYTKNLLTATKGNAVDITRKAFKSDDGKYQFNGSSLWKPNDSEYADKNGFKDRVGIRQHSILDPYDKFTKAIRFNGNQVYNGNPNSITYKSVLPRIHPNSDKDNADIIDNKNLMFSIENLAIRTIDNGNGGGIIDDELGSSIPLSEVGPFNGRIMWFPPYDLKLTEVSIAKYDSTVMIGRNEPMYNYQNSERSATLSFKLLMDYPEQINNYFNLNDAHKQVSEFFAFGGDPTIQYDIEFLTQQLNIKLKEKDNIGDKYKPNSSSFSNVKVTPINFYFPNDLPDVSTHKYEGIIDELYKTYHYEIDKTYNSTISTSDGLNKDVYVMKGLMESATTSGDVVRYLNVAAIPSDFSQNTATESIGDLEIPCRLNESLKLVFTNEDNRDYYKINIVGTASYLNHNTKNYNNELGFRRAKALRDLINKRLYVMFSNKASQTETIEKLGEYKEKMINKLGIEVIIESKGDSISNPKNSEAIKVGNEIKYPKMYDKETKLERGVEIIIERNSNTPPIDINKMNSDEQKKWNDLINEIDGIEKKIKLAKNNFLFEERKKEDKAHLNIGDAVKRNFYAPIFHSQTPEDFHKRLTFLQQCVRQGSATKWYNSGNNDGTITAKNSVFGRQPICILRVGDFFYTKIIIENVNIEYEESIWDTNPEGLGVQPMIANVTLQMKVMGGQSLSGPIDALQNAVSFNFYANSNFKSDGMYKKPANIAKDQATYNEGIKKDVDKLKNKLNLINKNKE